MGKFKVGCTLFCLGSEYLRGELDLEGCIRTAAEIGADGYEIVATQMIPTYPYVTDEVAGFFRRMTEKYGIAPVSYAANMDCGMRKDRDLTEDEMLAMAINDLKSAKKLGCTVMREQYLMSPQAMVRLAPYAEDYGIKVGIEIHNPDSPISPAIMAYREAYEKCGSKYIGFIPDFGCFATAPNKPKWDKAFALGVPEKVLQTITEMKYAGASQEEAIEKTAEMMGGNPGPAMDFIAGAYGFVQFKKTCKPELDGLKEIIPISFEMHGKCHYVDENLHEPAIPYEEIIPVIANSDFDGYIMTEYEDEGGYSGIEMTKRHMAMVRRLVNGENT